jgi:3-deoxy-D-manno-octulosonic-acid transferase
MQFMQIFYNIIVILVVLVATPVLFYRWVREEGFGRRLRQSLFGQLPKADIMPVAGKDCIWLHAASVGEIVAASPIIREIRRQFPEQAILVSVVTTNGYEMARRIVKDADSIIYFPLDLPWLSFRVVKQIRPKIFMLVETELWPNFLYAAKHYRIPVMMVNGRISDKSVGRYRYLGTILRDMLNTVVQYCMQSAIDAQYIIRLGAEPRRVVITGNTKFDQTYTDIGDGEKAALYRQLGLEGVDPVLVAGSTHRGEEELVLEAFLKVRAEFPGAKLVIAPRDTMRADEIAALAARYGLCAGRRTQAVKGTDPGHELVIIDTIGELGKIYSVGTAIFVGGSLVPHGGHNILEPAAHGRPIVVGPHMFNFKDTYALFSGRGACLTAYDQHELADIFLRILKNDKIREDMCAKTLAIIRENQGAAGKSVAYMKQVLENLAADQSSATAHKFR